MYRIVTTESNQDVHSGGENRKLVSIKLIPLNHNKGIEFEYAAYD